MMVINGPDRNIAHFDLDSFFVSVECLKNSKLKGKPVAVGGSGDRGVIASCSYEARRFGVKSAMPVRLARRLCPSLLVIRGDGDSYSRYSHLVTDIIRSQVPLFEKSSIDEFYIDMSGMDKFFGCARYTAELRQLIEKESGLDISYGLASNKLISKVATNQAKPHGQLLIPFGHEKEFLAPLPIEKIPMVGDKTATLLRQMGIDTVHLLSQVKLEYLVNLLGKPGLELWRRSNGIDETPVIPYHEAKSVSTENTFEKDTIDTKFLKSELVRMTEKIAYELRETNKLAGCITVKLRYSDFQTETRQASISYTAADHVLIEKAKELFDKLYIKRQLVRLIGVKLSHLVPGNYQISLFDDRAEMIDLYQAIDSIKHQYGEHLLIRGSGYKREMIRQQPKEKFFRIFKTPGCT